MSDPGSGLTLRTPDEARPRYAEPKTEKDAFCCFSFVSKNENNVVWDGSKLEIQETAWACAGSGQKRAPAEKFKKLLGPEPGTCQGH